MNNYAVLSDRFKYILYENSIEGYCYHKRDPKEITNRAKNADLKDEINLLKKYLPAIIT
jgi:hypothetical protein